LAIFNYCKNSILTNNILILTSNSLSLLQFNFEALLRIYRMGGQGNVELANVGLGGLNSVASQGRLGMLGWSGWEAQIL
jgi:hypothetical protein